MGSGRNDRCECVFYLNFANFAAAVASKFKPETGTAGTSKVYDFEVKICDSSGLKKQAVYEENKITSLPMYSIRIFDLENEGRDDLDENWQVNISCQRA